MGFNFHLHALLYPCLLVYHCPFICFIVGENVKQATFAKSPALSMQQFDGYVRVTDALTEFGTGRKGEESWVSATAFQWDLSERIEKINGKPHPYIICHQAQDGKKYSGNDRRMIIHDAIKNIIVDRNVQIKVVSNHKQLFCVYSRLFWSEAVMLEGLIVHPIHADMKILKGTIYGIERFIQIMEQKHTSQNNDLFVNQSLNFEVCPGYFDDTERDYEDEMQLIEKITNYIISTDSLKELNALSSFYWTSNPFNAETTSAKIWRDIFEKGINDGLCQDIFKNNLSWSYNTAIDGFSGTSILNVKFMFNKSEQQINRVCILTLLGALATMEEICTIETNYQEETFNSIAQYLVQSGIVDSRPWFDSGLDGNGQVIALSDTGIDIDNCYFQGPNRKIVDYVSYVDSGDTLYGHGTHCAGIIAGKRSNNGVDEVKGMADGIAPGAKLAFIDCGDSEGRLTIPQTRELLNTGRSEIQEKIARIHSVSWGSFGNYYSAKSAHFDEFMYENDDFLIVVAIGNSFGNGLSTEATSKNAISVGAHNSYGSSSGPGMLGTSYVADFSGRGPTLDGRSKPDIVAPGKFLLSAGGVPNSYGECDPSSKPTVGEHGGGLVSTAGTSVATAVVTGAAALIRQYFEEGWYPTGTKISSNNIVPSGALVKAVLLNGAQFMKGVDNGDCTSTPVEPYDTIQNFGRISLVDSLYIKGKSNIQVQVWDKQTIQDGELQQFTIRIDKASGCSSNVLSATLTWMEESSIPGCRFCVLNDLDLTVERLINTDISFPNGLSQKDSMNNVERVRISNVHDKELFIVRVKASNLAKPSQKYALVVSGCFGGAKNTLPINVDPFNDETESGCKQKKKSHKSLMIIIIVLMSFLFVLIITCAILKCKKKMDGLR